VCADQTNLAQLIKNILQQRGYIVLAPHCYGLDASVIHLAAAKNINSTVLINLFHILEKSKLRSYIVEKEIVKKLKAIRKQTNYDIYFIIYVKEIQDINKNFFVYPLDMLERTHAGNYMISEYRLETATPLVYFQK